MKRFFLIVLISLFIFCSCEQHYSHEGLDYYIQHGYADSSLSICSLMAISKNVNPDFFDKYPYLEGDYHHDYVDDGMFHNALDRALVWLKYDDIIYEQAKQSCMNSRAYENTDLDGKEALGFTFYTVYEFEEYGKFPYYFTAFGYDDEKNTIISLGFYCDKDAEKETVEAAKTDLEGFIKNYFGEWYDWEE